MMCGRLQLIKRVICIFLSYGYIVVKFIQFITLFFGFFGQVFGHIINVGHYLSDGIDVVVSLLDDLFHELSFLLQLHVFFVRLVSLHQQLVLLTHAMAIARAATLAHAHHRLSGDFVVLVVCILDLLSDVFQLPHL